MHIDTAPYFRLIQQSTAYLQGTNITDNHAGRYVGAIEVSDHDSWLYIENAVFKRNSAGDP